MSDTWEGTDELGPYIGSHYKCHNPKCDTDQHESRYYLNCPRCGSDKSGLLGAVHDYLNDCPSCRTLGPMGPKGVESLRPGKNKPQKSEVMKAITALRLYQQKE